MSDVTGHCGGFREIACYHAGDGQQEHMRALTLSLAKKILRRVAVGFNSALVRIKKIKYWVFLCRLFFKCIPADVTTERKIFDTRAGVHIADRYPLTVLVHARHERMIGLALLFVHFITGEVSRLDYFQRVLVCFCPLLR